MKKQFEERNLSMIMDFYEMTMCYGYFKENNLDAVAVFDVFYRQNPDGGSFCVFAGLEQIMEYIENLHFAEEDIKYLRQTDLFDEPFLNYLSQFHFTGDIYAMPEGTIMYPHEPILTVVAPLLEAQLVETAILLQINHQSLIATKARRICRAAGNRVVSDFGARRAHNMDSAVYGARAAYIGGAAATATVLAGQMFQIPINGTMAHSWIMFFQDEFTAFCKYARAYPDSSVFLVDTYDVLRSGIPNAIRAAKEVLHPMGKRLKGIRLDSGDLSVLSRKARKMLDEEGMEDCNIIASNSLDENTISKLIAEGACIDSFGVGERLITSKSQPVFGAVYKLVAVKTGAVFEPRMKLSENIEKITNPGRKEVYRVYNQQNKAVADLIAMQGEQIPEQGTVNYIDPKNPGKIQCFEHCRYKPLHCLVMKQGMPEAQVKDIHEIAAYVKRQLEEEILQEEQELFDPVPHILVFSAEYYQMKQEMISSISVLN